MFKDFNYIFLNIPKKCIHSVWLLTCSNKEYGGQFNPQKNKFSKCELGCDIKLIQGTGFETKSDVKFYNAKGTAKTVQIASTPFYEEVFKVYPMCSSKESINMIFHTHPIHLMKSKNNIGMFAPPSLGDIFAHTVLSNMRNFKQNKQLNTTIVISFEGLYVYSITPSRFNQLLLKTEADVGMSTNISDNEKENWKTIGECPFEVMEQLKEDIFNELREGNEQFYIDAQNLINTQFKKFKVDTVPVLNDTKWRSKEQTNVECNFLKTLQSDETVIAFLRNNAYTKTLNDHGFYYLFYPSPFTKDVIFPGHGQPHL